MLNSVEIPVALPRLRAFRLTTETLYSGVKEYFAVGRVERGRTESWSRGTTWRCAPGSIHVKEPGDVHRDIAHDGPVTLMMIALPLDEVERAREAGKTTTVPHLALGDERAAPFHRLHDAIAAGADRFALEVALTEAIATFAKLGEARALRSRPVRRALELLRERLAEPISLDDLARAAEQDKFHLCRAFRAQVGMPPHAYLTHLRIQRARELLAQGVRASELAPRVGLYDQAQLTRHFRRIVGTTPARYAGVIHDREGRSSRPVSSARRRPSAL